MRFYYTTSQCIQQSNGYYYILNHYTAKYLTSPDNDTANNGITEEALNPSIASRQLWKITYLSDRVYEFQSQRMINSGLVLSVGNGFIGIDPPGTNVEQRTRSDAVNKGKWVMVKIQVYSAVAATQYNAHDIAHNANFNSIVNNLTSINKTPVATYFDNNMTLEGKLFIEILKNSKILTVTAHGSPTTMAFTNSSVTTWDIMSEPSYCMSDLELVVLMSCRTAEGYMPGSSSTLVGALIEQGAENVIGFKIKIACVDANAWEKAFFEGFATGLSYSAACVYADTYVDQALPAPGNVHTTDAVNRVHATWEP